LGSGYKLKTARNPILLRDEPKSENRSSAYSPENRGASASVEYVFDLGGIKYAIKHAIVEAASTQLIVSNGGDVGTYELSFDDDKGMAKDVANTLPFRRKSAASGK
jgi:hypothetical protein